MTFHLKGLTLSTLVLSLVSLASAVPVVEARDDIASVRGALVVARATSFCSSLLNLKDVTTTQTSTGTSSIVTTTVTAPPCTDTLPASTVTEVTTNTIVPPVVTTTLTLVPETTTSTTTLATPSTTTTTVLDPIITVTTSTLTDTTTTTVTSYTFPPLNKKRGLTLPKTTTKVMTTATTTTTTTTTPSSKPTTTSANICAAGGNFPQIRSFACSAISKGCSSYVTAQTTIVTTSVAGSTVTSSVTTKLPCGTVTLPPVTTTNTVPFTAAASTSTETSTPPVVTSVVSETPATTTITETSTPPVVTSTASETTTTTLTSVTTTTYPSPTCAAGTDVGPRAQFAKSCGVRGVRDPFWASRGVDVKGTASTPDLEACNRFCVQALYTIFWASFQRSTFQCTCYFYNEQSTVPDPDFDFGKRVWS